MGGWVRRRSRSFLRAWRRLFQPEILRSAPVRRSDVISAVRGWSLWHPSPAEDALLSSLVVSYRWDGPVVRAGKPEPVVRSLSYSPNSEPRPEVGFFGLKPSRFHCDSVLGSYPSLACVGTVSLYGRVIEHEEGFRAEVARVDSLWVIEERLARDLWTEPGDVVAALQCRYRCDAGLAPTYGCALTNALESAPYQNS